MASLAILNFQFAKDMRRVEEGSLFLEEGLMRAEEAFPQKQKIVDDLLIKDYIGFERIKYRNKRGDKEYIHKFFIKPQDNIYIFNVTNTHTTSIVARDQKDVQTDDYMNCLVIIDNRDGIQRMLIEQKRSAFQDVKTLVNILQVTLNRYLAKYGLMINIMHLQEPKVFWDFVFDTKAYPQGFYKITFYLPALNLERLSKALYKVLTTSRQVFDSDLEWTHKAPKGGRLPLDPHNTAQNELINYIMGEVGAESGRSNIKLYSNTDKQKPIHVGKDSYRVIVVKDTLFERILKDAANGDILNSLAFEDIKHMTITDIDSNHLLLEKE